MAVDFVLDLPKKMSQLDCLTLVVSISNHEEKLCYCAQPLIHHDNIFDVVTSVSFGHIEEGCLVLLRSGDSRKVEKFAHRNKLAIGNESRQKPFQDVGVGCGGGGHIACWKKSSFFPHA